jgi:ABC-type bacteriocin/lantibiotic exporter with double-glycine peptidase domain
MPTQAYLQAATPMVFQTAITLKDLAFRYIRRSPRVLRNVNLQIPKGSRVGFIGVIASGKSTLLNVVMGLLCPTEGALLIDNTPVNLQNTRAWQAHISQVPQAIYLSDASLAENIAFGVQVKLIDLQLVKQAVQQMRLLRPWKAGSMFIIH